VSLYALTAAYRRKFYLETSALFRKKAILCFVYGAILSELRHMSYMPRPVLTLYNVIDI